MAVVRLPNGYVFRLTVEQDGHDEPIYDLAVSVDEQVLVHGHEQAVESVLRLIGRNLTESWKGHVF